MLKKNVHLELDSESACRSLICQSNVVPFIRRHSECPDRVEYLIWWLHSVYEYSQYFGFVGFHWCATGTLEFVVLFVQLFSNIDKQTWCIITVFPAATTVPVIQNIHSKCQVLVLVSEDQKFVFLYTYHTDRKKIEETMHVNVWANDHFHIFSK